MVKQHYRWDFIGLSSYDKPTPETSPKVVDGSTYYEADTSKLFVFYKDHWYEKTPTGGGGGGSVNSVNNVSPDSNGNVNLTPSDIGAQAALTAGSNVTIEDGVISAVDTTYSAFTGATASTAGVAGLVPAPAAGDESKVLKGDGTWAVPEGGIKTLTTADYDYPDSGTKTSVALWRLPRGIYEIPAGVAARTSTSESVASDRIGSIIAVINRANQTNITLFGSSYYGMWSQIYVTNPSTGIKTLFDNSHISSNAILTTEQVIDNVASTGTKIPLSANQGKALKDLIDSLVIKNAGAPTTSTVGTVGMLYEDTTNAKLYQLTAIDTTDPQNPSYTWSEVGGSSVNVVQTTGTSTTDVMSQNAVTGMVFADGSARQKVQIGSNASAVGFSSTALGDHSKASQNYSAALGYYADAEEVASIAIGPYSRTNYRGEVNIGSTQTFYGYSNSNYRLLTGVYDGQSDHDAATVGQLKMGVLSTTPTGTTVGFPGRLYTLDSGGGAYEVYLCVHDNGDNTYVWKQVSLI